MLRVNRAISGVLNRSAVVIGLAVMPAMASSQSLTKPVEDVLLTVTGKISVTNDGAMAVFDLPMLAAMDTVTFETSTIWTDGVHTFAGVPLVDLMKAVGATGDTIRAIAANDYAVDIPDEDWVEGGPILAFMMDGKTMSLRDKGPLWVMYPYDTNPRYQTEVAYSRSIWQLKSMDVK